MFELIFPGWLAGVFLTLATGPLGSFIVWRRMASIGDTLSHSSLLGFALSILFDCNSFYIILFFISALAIILAWVEEILPFSIETALSIISHSSLSMGMVVISLISKNKTIDMNSYLFGDLLSVTSFDLFFIAFGSILVMSILLFKWNSILLATINEELAKIDGINLKYSRLIIMLATAITISIAIKFVGVLLVTSLLIIPPATAQKFAGSPEKMVFIAVIISMLSVTGGIFLSVFFNTPTSPSIVLFSSFLYFLSNILSFFNYFNS